MGATPLRCGLRVLALAMLVGALGALVSLSQIGFALEEDVGLSWLFRVRGPRPPPEEVVGFVRLDRDSLARLRSLPAAVELWPEPLRSCEQRSGGLQALHEVIALDRLPRALHACLVMELERRGATVIGFDVVFRRDAMREAGIPALAEAIRSYGRVVLLERAVRRWLRPAPSAGGSAEALQADVLEGPHTALKAAAIATAPFLLPRNSAQVHQFWAFNPALAAGQPDAGAGLEVRPCRRSPSGAATRASPSPRRDSGRALGRRTGWFRARGGRPRLLRISGVESRRLSTADVRLWRRWARYRGADGYYLNFYGPPGSFPSCPWPTS